MAGCSRSFIGSLPNLPCSSNQPSTVPGTDTGKGPRGGILSTFSLRNSSRNFSSVSDFGERPLPLRPYSFFVFASQTMANRSPPTPLPVGSMSPIVAFAAMAASTAVPPRLSTSRATWLTSGWLVAAMPCMAMTSERVGTSEPLGRDPAYPPSIAMQRTTAGKTRRNNASGRLLGARYAGFENLPHFAIGYPLLESALRVVGNHAAPEGYGHRVAQVLGDFPPAGETIEDQLHGEPAD